MQQRYVSIWFRHLATDWFALRQPAVKTVPFILRGADRNRMVVKAANLLAEQQGVYRGMVVADARIIVSHLEVQDDKPDVYPKLLTKLAEWCIRFTPITAIDLPEGLILDATGCTHLWGSDEKYLEDISSRLQQRGYDVRLAIADTIGTAWAVARYSSSSRVVPVGKCIDAILKLPPQSLRIESEVVERLRKLGLKQIKQFINLPRPSLRRRFGNHFIQQLDKAIGQQLEIPEPVIQSEIYEERLMCFDPIVTAPGIAIALEKLLTTLCERLRLDQKGLRKAMFKYYRIDGKVGSIEIGTSKPSFRVTHLQKLFATKLTEIEPDLGIELFILNAPIVDECLPEQNVLWKISNGLNDVRLSEFIDKVSARIGTNAIKRFFPSEHHWPERSFTLAPSIHAETINWLPGDLRPLHILRTPERVDVSAPIPDYPPMLFVRKGKVHNIKKADGPERIEQEWWQQQGEHRDYYRVEDEDGHRYWLFRLGHYNDQHFQWFLHGFFA